MSARPLPIGITVVDQLIGHDVPHLDGGVRERPLGRPLDLIAGRLLDQERLAAAPVAVGVEAFLDGVVKDLALGHFGGCGNERPVSLCAC
jgi:hypothetical protein